jgi:hypothetical protein
MERRSEKDYKKQLSECVSNDAYGYGRRRNLKTGEWLYNKETHVVGIFGVAWKHDHSLNHSENVELMNPDNYWRHCGRTIPTTYVLLVWKIDGQRRKSWENRTVTRRIWGNNEEADNAIYTAARKQEKRRGELETGVRKAESRTPSVALDRATTPLRKSPARGSRKTSPAKESRSARSASELSKQKPAKDISEILNELRNDFLQIFGVDSIAELHPDDQRLVREELHRKVAMSRAAVSAY